MVSASASKETLGECLEAGCDDAIAKPIQAEKIFDALEKYLKIEWIYEYRRIRENHGQKEEEEIKPDI